MRLLLPAFLLLCLCACAGSQPAEQVSEAGLPPFPTGRESSTISWIRDGIETTARSAGCSDFDATSLLIAGSDPAGIEWARYSFTVDELPEAVALGLTPAQSSTAWLAVANFTTERWDISGPYSDSEGLKHSVPLSSDHLSTSQQVHCAVIVYGSASAYVRRIELHTTGDNQLPRARIRPTPRTGPAGTSIELYADAFDRDILYGHDGYIAMYEWDLDGDGSFELNSGLDDTVDTVMPSERTVINLRATDNLGGTTTTLAALSPTAVVLDTQNYGTILSSTIVNGKAAVAYVRGYNPASIMYSHEVTASSGLWSEPIEIATTTLGNDMVVLAAINNKPAILFNSGQWGGFPDPKVHFRMAQDSDGTTWNDEVVIGIGHAYGYINTLTEVNGRPALAYLAGTELNQLAYLRADDADGSSWGATSSVALPEPLDADPVQTSLVVVEGRPAIAYTMRDSSWPSAEARYVRALDVDGTTWAAPQVIRPFPATMTFFNRVSMAVVNGLPAVVMTSNEGYATHYLRSTDADGTSWVEGTLDYPWDRYTGNHTYPPTLTTIDGLPVVYSAIDRGLHLAVASDANGAAWGPQQWLDQSNADYNCAALVDMPGGIGVFQTYDDLSLVFDLIP